MMVVICESCKTKFRLDPTRFRNPIKKVRCTICGYVFLLSRPPLEPLEETQVDLIRFDAPEDAPSEDHIALEMGDLMGSAPIEEESSFAPQPKKKKTLKTASLAFVFLAVLLGGGVLWLSMTTSSSSVSTQTREAPAGDTVQPLVTIMDTTQAYFLDNAQAGQLFVVEGEIVNETNKPVSFIMLEGKLYGKNYQVVQSQRCFSGNPISRNDLAKLGINEIQNRMMNREGKDLINVHIPTAKRVPFMLVFHNLPEMDSLTDYSVEIISAKVD